MHSSSRGLPVVPSAKPQLARLQESRLEARSWGRDVDPIDVKELNTRKLLKLERVTMKTRKSSKLQSIHIVLNY